MLKKKKGHIFEIAHINQKIYRDKYWNSSEENLCKVSPQYFVTMCICCSAVPSGENTSELALLISLTVKI